jgi:hypothetical protein
MLHRAPILGAMLVLSVMPAQAVQTIRRVSLLAMVYAAVLSRWICLTLLEMKTAQAYPAPCAANVIYVAKP